MKKFLFILIFPMICQAKTIKVAIIDTGFDFKSTWRNIDKTGLSRPKLCNGGHIDFTRDEFDSEYLKDNHGHGTHVAGIIAKGLDEIDYCLVIIKFYDPYKINGIANSVKSFQWAIDQKVDIINYSAGGTEYSDDEKEVVLKALKLGIKIVSASGNEKTRLYKQGVGLSPKQERKLASLNRKVFTCHYYPACYNSLIECVGNELSYGMPAPSSNYGDAITVWEEGTSVYSLLPDNSFGVMSGTSQATAVRTGKIVKELYKLNKFDGFNPHKYLKSYKVKMAS